MNHPNLIWIRDWAVAPDLFASVSARGTTVEMSYRHTQPDGTAEEVLAYADVDSAKRAAKEIVERINAALTAARCPAATPTAMCVGGGVSSGCGCIGGVSGGTCPECGGMLLSDEASAEAAGLAQNTP